MCMYFKDAVFFPVSRHFFHMCTYDGYSLHMLYSVAHSDMNIYTYIHDPV